MTAEAAIAFDDVLLAPQFSDIPSRGNISLASTLHKVEHTFTLPIISSPMDTVTGGQMAAAIGRAGGLGIVHRYLSIEDQVKETTLAFEEGAEVVGAAIGVDYDFYCRASSLLSINKNVILCIDVAHGHHLKVKNALMALRNGCARDRHIMAGNIATLEGFNALAKWGADSVRCGIGGGSICTTRLQTGHGVPTLGSIMDCAPSTEDVSLVADGGFRFSGDIVKGLAAGADFVMLGSMLAGTEECPGKVLKKDGTIYKVYRGMASRSAQMDWRGKSSSPEGVFSEVSFRGSVAPVLEDIAGAIRSGLSYSGARTISELRSKAKWVEQSYSSRVEGSAHVYEKGM